MNWLDIAVLMVCGMAVLYGFRAGLFRMLVPLAVVLVGLALSSRLSGPIGNLFSSFTNSETTQTIMAFFVIFVTLFIASAILSIWLRVVLQFVPFFGLANGLGGALAGVAVGFVLLAGILTAAQRHPVGNVNQTIEESPLGSFFPNNFGVVMRGVRLLPVDWDAKVEGLKGALPTDLPTSLPDGMPEFIPDLLPNFNPNNRPEIPPASNQ